MSTKDRPQQEDKHIVASSDVENGLQDHGKTIDFTSGVSEGIFDAPEVVVNSIDDNNMENGRVFRVNDPPDGLGGNENAVEDKAEGNKASLIGISGATQTDEEIDRAALEALTNIIRNESQNYTEEEKQAIRKGKEIYEKCKKGENFDDLKSPDERVKMKLVHVDGASSGTGLSFLISRDSGSPLRLVPAPSKRRLCKYCTRLMASFQPMGTTVDASQAFSLGLPGKPNSPRVYSAFMTK